LNGKALRAAQGTHQIEPKVCMSQRVEHADPQRFVRALREQHAGLGRAARRILRCPDAAHDAVQEALITLWLHPPDHAHERAWLLRTVVHRSLHERRTQQRRRRWEGAAVEALLGECPLCTPQRELEQREIGALLDQALAALPEPYRAPFLLREVEGWDYTRIASALAIPIGTVRSRLNRARAALRARVEAGLAEAPEAMKEVGA
jgi:RNA polymerase sigma-70 factor (ECF subfamily)